MAVFARAKRVKNPLDDYFSSGSDHSGGSVDGDSPCLSELVHCFLEDDSGIEPSGGWESDSEASESAADCASGAIEDVTRLAATCSDSDPYRNLLFAHVLRATEVYSCLRSEQRSVFVWKVTAFLRELGHDAAVCKSRWSASGELTAGSYEFIDVVFQPRDAPSSHRYFVDLDFASEFDIARPTRQYARVLQSLPSVFVGKAEDLRAIVRIACDAAKRSLKSGGLSLPPWRRYRYMQNKWFGPYKRTTGGVGLTTTATSSTPFVPAVSCRSIGFDDAVNSRVFVRTR